MPKPSALLTFVLVVGLVVVHSAGQDKTPVETKRIDKGELSVLFRDNSQSPEVLSGIDSLYNVKHAPEFDAFDPDTPGASAGLNFEHIISGHETPNNKFTPRSGIYRLLTNPDLDSVTLVRRAEDSPWKVDSTLTYTVVDPHYIDFEFRCTPRDASKFGTRGYGLFFFANYMNDVEDVALNFRGRADRDAPEQWISADAPNGHPDWNGGGNYRSLSAGDLNYDNDVQFRLNTWSYHWPRFSEPFYYGMAKNGMTLILMFDRLHSQRDQIRFSLYKFKLPKHPRPAWDFQYVINHVKTDEQYGFRGRLVWKKFVSPDDCIDEYKRWSASLQTARIQQLKMLGATVFIHGDTVAEVNANNTAIVDDDLRHLESFTDMTDLSLEGTKIKDAGIAYLHGLQKLEWLNLYRCPVGDAGLEKLKRLKSLQHLPIGSSHVTDAGLVHLAEMQQLVYLGLRDTNVTDKGLQHLATLTDLTGLHLGETKVTDAGLARLQTMQKLEKLWLDNTEVTDEGVKALVKLESLRELHIRDTPISETGVKQLRSALPRCEIDAGRD